MSMLSPLNDNNSSHIRLENKWTIAKSYSKQTINNLLEHLLIQGSYQSIIATASTSNIVDAAITPGLS